MDNYDRPSCAAIATVGAIAEVAAAVIAALKPLGYRPYDGDIPSWHRAADDEWLGFIGTQIGPLAVLLPEHQGWAFRVAYAAAVSQPEAGWVAYRRELGMSSCFKYFALGAPQFKHGDDPDLEVEWNIAPGLAVDVPTPIELGLPETAEALEGALGNALRPYAAHRKGLQADDRCFGVLHRSSALWL